MMDRLSETAEATDLSRRNAALEARVRELERALSVRDAAGFDAPTVPRPTQESSGGPLPEAVGDLLQPIGVYLWTCARVGSSPLVISGMPQRSVPGAEDTRDDLWQDLIHPEDASRFGAAFGALRTHGASFDTELRARFGSESYRAYRCRGVCEVLADGGLRAAGTFSDIEAQRALAAEMRAVNDKFFLVISGAHGGVFDWPDTSQDQISIDDSMIQLLEYDVTEIEQTASWWSNLVHPDDRHRLIADLRRSITTREDFDATYRVQFKRSGYRHIRSLARVTPLETGARQKCRLTGMILDVEEAWRSTAHLNDINRQLDSFAYLVAHDLGASLRHMLGFANFLREDYGAMLDDTARSFLDRIDQSGENAVRMIEDLQLYARTGTSKLRLGQVDLNALMLEIQETLSLQQSTRHVTWIVQPLPIVHADKTQMQMLFQNLLSNAIKFTRGKEGAQVTVSAQQLNAVEVEVSVCDNGIGFDQGQQERLLEPFRRGHDDDRFEGTGMGLANVARIVARHGGRISATGVPGEGAEFRVVLTGTL